MDGSELLPLAVGKGDPSFAHMTELHSERVAIRLLTVITVLLSVMVLGTAVAAGAAFFAYQKVMGQADARSAGKLSVEALKEVTRRQKELSARLQERSIEASKELVVMEKRRKDLGEIAANPLTRFTQVVQFTQLLCDQVLLLERQITEIELMVGQVTAPLTTESDPDPSSVDGHKMHKKAE